MSRLARWRSGSRLVWFVAVLVVAVVHIIVGTWVSASGATTTALPSIGYYYAEPGLVRVEPHEADVVEGTPAQLSRGEDGSQSCGLSAWGTSATSVAQGVATNSADDLVDLAIPRWTKHILDRHMFPGEIGNSLFPKNWSAEKSCTTRRTSLPIPV